jgi:hypothetical protein
VSSYLLSVAVVVVGLLALLAVLLRVRRTVRRFTDTAAAANLRVTDMTGLLRARTAALGVAIRQGRHVRIDGSLSRVPSGEPAETGGRPWATLDRWNF